MRLAKTYTYKYAVYDGILKNPCQNYCSARIYMVLANPNHTPLFAHGLYVRNSLFFKARWRPSLHKTCVPNAYFYTHR